MPSCQACGKWFSEEDNGCGCDGEVLHMTRASLRKIVARVLRDLAPQINEYDGKALLHEAALYEAGEKEVPGE